MMPKFSRQVYISAKQIKQMLKLLCGMITLGKSRYQR